MEVRKETIRKITLPQSPSIRPSGYSGRCLRLVSGQAGRAHDESSGSDEMGNNVDEFSEFSCKQRALPISWTQFA